MSIVYSDGKMAVVGKYKDEKGNVSGYRLAFGDYRNPTYIMDIPPKKDLTLSRGYVSRTEIETSPCKLLTSVEEPKYKKEYLKVLEGDTGTVWVRVTDAAKSMKNIANFMTIINEGNFYKLWRKMNWRGLRIVDNGFFISLEGKNQSVEVNLDEIDTWLNEHGVSGFTKTVWTASKQERGYRSRGESKCVWNYAVGYAFINDKATIPDVPATRMYVASDRANNTSDCRFVTKDGSIFEVALAAKGKSSAIKFPSFTTNKSYKDYGIERDDFVVSDDGDCLISVKNLYELSFAGSHSLAIEESVRECVMNNAILSEVCTDADTQFHFHEFSVKSTSHGVYRMSIEAKVDFGMVPYDIEEVVKAMASELDNDLSKAHLEKIETLIYPIENVRGNVELVSDDTVMFSIDIMVPKKKKEAYTPCPF